MIRIEVRRAFRRNRALSVLSVVILSAGFATSTTSLTLMRALTAKDSRGLSAFGFGTIAEETTGGGSESISWDSFEQLRNSLHVPGMKLAAYAEPIRIKLSPEHDGREISLAGVSMEFFPEFTQRTTFVAGEANHWEHQGELAPVVLSSRLANLLFTSRTQALGKTVLIGGHKMQVSGVADERFSGLWTSADAWTTPTTLLSLCYEARVGTKYSASRSSGGEQTGPFSLRRIPAVYVLIGSKDEAYDAARSSVERALKEPANLPLHLHLSDGITKNPPHDRKVEEWIRLTTFISVILVLCAGFNYTGVLLARTPLTVEEARLKRTLGAGSWNILTENLIGPIVIVLTGYLLGIGFAIGGISILSKQMLWSVPGNLLSWALFVRSACVEFGAALAFSLLVAVVPALRLIRDSGTPQLGHSTTTARAATFTIRAVAVLQLSFCVVVILLSVAMIRYARKLLAEPLGFDYKQLNVAEVGPASRTGVLTFSTGGGIGYPIVTFTRSVLDNAHIALPGVQDAAASSCAPFGQQMKMLQIHPLEDHSGAPRYVRFCGVSRNFFSTLYNPIHAGPGFSKDRFGDSVSEIVVNQQLAKELWGDVNPVGRSVDLATPEWGLRFSGRVVGVSDDMRFEGPGTSTEATVFLPLKENVFALSIPLYFMTRGPVSSPALGTFIGEQAVELMPDAGVDKTYSVDEHLASTVFEDVLRVYVPTVGALVMAGIAYLGLYGVLLYSLNLKRKELAIRACFGASRWHLRRQIVAESLSCSGFAVLIAVLAWLLGLKGVFIRLIPGMKWSWTDVLAVPLCCVALSLVLSLIPANTAAEISPVQTLKES